MIKLKYKHVNIYAIYMRQICSRKNYKMYINDAFNLARNKKAWDTLTYIHMIPIMRFLHHFIQRFFF